MPIPAAMATSALAQNGRAALEFPVIGAKVTNRRARRNGGFRESTVSFQLRGWEVVAAALGLAGIYYVYKGGLGNGTNTVSPWGLLGVSPVASLLVAGTPLPGVLPPIQDILKPRLPSIADELKKKYGGL